MKFFATSLAAASLALATTIAAPATAQVQGNIATIDTPSVIIGTTAFQNAYQQVSTTYKPQIDTRRTRSEERQTLLRQLDTNSDGDLDQAEQTAAAGTPQATRIQAIDQEIQGLSAQIDGARIYAVEQILAQYSPALQEVVQAQSIQMIVSPEAIVYAPQQADITQQVTTSLNAKVPSVQIVPPQGWQPNRNTVALYQQIQQVLLQAQAIQQAQAAQQQQQQALILVTDTGVGIVPEDQAKIFDRFYRVDTARSRQTGNSGLGLAISTAIAQAHKGTITVTSQPGQGSTFTVSLPISS
ncbi:MAG: ATP-binding protein, partial [Pseudomonadota bacterium]